MKPCQLFRNEKGFIKFTVVTIILALCVYSGIKFGIPYYKHAALRSEAKELARISLGDVDKTRVLVFEKARELKIPIEEKAILVTKTERSVRVRTSWEETVDLLGYYQKTLRFNIDVEE